MIRGFSEEIQFFYRKMINGDKFALARFGDGEWDAISKRKRTFGVDKLSGKTEWSTMGSNIEIEKSIDLLLAALKYADSGYYVGICPCFREMIRVSNQLESNITFANLFVGSNYDFFVENFIEYFKTQKIILVANKEARVQDLPFRIEEFFPINYNAWIHDMELLYLLKESKIEDSIFLFCAGPFANILCSNLWATNKTNIYLDIGSTLDPWTKTGSSRAYYLGEEPFSSWTCPCKNARFDLRIRSRISRLIEYFNNDSRGDN